MNAKKRAFIFSLLEKNTPNPTTELVYKSDFQLLIAVILSAQTTDIAVNKVTQKLFTIAPNANALSRLTLETTEDIIKTIGLYKNKAQNILKTSAILNHDYDGRVPNNRKALESLPGVGRKTANVILNTLFKEPVIAVDTHIFRLGNRINLAKGKTPLEVEKKLTRLTPKEYLADAHHLLILHGRYTCKAIKPECQTCCIYDLCEYKGKI